MSMQPFPLGNIYYKSIKIIEGMLFITEGALFKDIMLIEIRFLQECNTSVFHIAQLTFVYRDMFVRWKKYTVF